jgi:hypothetical protein
MVDTNPIHASEEPLPSDDITSKHRPPSQEPTESFQSVLDQRENSVQTTTDPVFKTQSPMELMKGSQQVAQVSPDSVRQQLQYSSSKISELHNSMNQLNPASVQDDTQKQLHKGLQQLTSSLHSSSLVLGVDSKEASAPKKPIKMIHKTLNLLASAQKQIDQLGNVINSDKGVVSIGKLLRVQYHLYRLQRSVELSTAIIGKTASSLNTLFNTQL